MAENTIHIKNMVCNRCIMVVEGVLKSMDITYANVQLGTVLLTTNLEVQQKQDLAQKLATLGFELLESKKNVLVEKIKNLITKWIQYNDVQPNINTSVFLTESLNMDYSTLSHTFSEVENITIEQYTILQKMEKAKELLSYGEKSLTQIADILGYGNVAYLSSQFKKITGLSPTQYKNHQSSLRTPLDKLQPIDHLPKS